MFILLRGFYIACLNNYMFRPYIGHHQVEHFLIITNYTIYHFFVFVNEKRA